MNDRLTREQIERAGRSGLMSVPVVRRDLCNEMLTLLAERDEARAEVERLRRVLRSIEQDTVSTNLWLRQKTHDALELARVALSPSPPDTEEH